MNAVYSSADSTEAARLERLWAERVAGNREQAERVREEPDAGDHYQPIAHAFRADPHRSDDPALNALLEIAQGSDVWLDVGAGAGRFALPISLHVSRVIAIEPSHGMREELSAAMVEHGVTNLDVRNQRWPSDDPAITDIADVALISHVAYDIEQIGAFIHTLVRAASRECVALLFDRTPSSLFREVWPEIHGEEQVQLPGGEDFIALLRARGSTPIVSRIERNPDGSRFAYDTPDDALEWARRRLWLSEDSDKLATLERAAHELLVETDGGWSLPDRPVQLMIRWRSK